MVDNYETNKDETPILRFGLLIEKQIFNNNQYQIKVTSNNQGISDPEVILVVEAWLEKMKDNFKQPIKDGFIFFKPDKP